MGKPLQVINELSDEINKLTYEDGGLRKINLIVKKAKLVIYRIFTEEAKANYINEIEAINFVPRPRSDSKIIRKIRFNNGKKDFLGLLEIMAQDIRLQELDLSITKSVSQQIHISDLQNALIDKSEMGSYRETMQVCMQGHIITAKYNKNPHSRQKFCTRCGEKTITQCQNCKADIPGDMIYDSIVVLGMSGPIAPSICAECGGKFPWFEIRRKENEEELAQRKIEAEERKQEQKLATVKKIEVKIEGHGNVVNMGSMIDNVISNAFKLSQAGDIQIANALENVTKSISASNDINDNQKQQYLEQVKFLSEEAIKPQENRSPKAVLQALIAGGLGTLDAAGNLAGVWSTWGPVIKSYFLD